MANLKLIREICKQKKITLRELCRQVGIDESSLQSAMRRGSTKRTTLESISGILNVPVELFYEGYIPDDTKELKKEIEYLKELIKEKDRLISLLMKDRDE